MRPRLSTWFLFPSSQDPPLPGVRGFPDDHPEGLGEAGWLAAHLHHLHPERHHGQLGLGHIPALQSRGKETTHHPLTSTCVQKHDLQTEAVSQ